MREIIFFRTDSGTCPVEDFLEELSGKQAQKVVWVMQLVEDLERVPKQYFKKLVNTNDIWEIRAQVGSNIFRILGFFINNNRFIATNGFQKKTQEIPRQEIALAEQRKIIFLNRGGK